MSEEDALLIDLDFA